MSFLNKLINSIRDINWQPLYEFDDIDVATNYFTKCLKTVFDMNAPFKTKMVRGKPAPWLNKDFKRFIDNKNRLLRKARKTKNDDDWEQYRTARNKCNAKIKEAKRKHHRNLIEENTNNPRKFWDAFKQVFPSKSKISVGSPTKSENKNLVNKFSTYYANIVSELKSKAISFSSYIWKFRDIKGIRTTQRFCFSNVSKTFIEKQLKSLKRSKAAGPDELPPGMIKDCRNEILNPLTYLVNLSLRSGRVPSLWKVARVTPIHKSGDLTKPENYRPISILPIFSKILERAIHTQLSSYLENNYLLCNQQFGYRSKKSTKLASTLLCDNIRKSIDMGELVGAVFIDLTKAFDTVGHDVLLSKLHEYGIGGIEHEWMKSYLFNRQQFVFQDGVSSPLQPLLSGVPQGSILGPLLFLVFLNDFPECLQNSRTIMYADDTVIFVADKNKERMEQLLNDDLERIANYFNDNELIINLKKGKTEAMMFGTGKRLAGTDKHLEVSFRGQPINNVKEYKYLGNIVDQLLNFNTNFEKVYKKASGRLKLLKRLRSYITADAAHRIVTMMIHPILTYRSTVKL